MGFRMNVCREIDRNNYKYWRGNDHKLYGYYAFEDVAKSFVYISKFMKEQWEEFKDETYDDPRDRYDYICYVGATDDVVLSEEAFEKFASLYLADVAKNKPEETFKNVCSYMISLAMLPGDKVIWWS